MTSISGIMEKLRTGTADAAEQAEVATILADIAGAYALLVKTGEDADEARATERSRYKELIAIQARLISALEGQASVLEDRNRMLERELDARDSLDQEEMPP
jgi:hypothetical protein